jgi:hypothetical protein
MMSRLSIQESVPLLEEDEGMELSSLNEAQIEALIKFILASKSGPGDGGGGGARNNVISSLKSIFACEETLKILPSLTEFEEVAQKLASGTDRLCSLAIVKEL